MGPQLFYLDFHTVNIHRVIVSGSTLTLALENLFYVAVRIFTFHVYVMLLKL